MELRLPAPLRRVRTRLARAKNRIVVTAGQAKVQFDEWQQTRETTALRERMRDVRKVHVGCGPRNHFEGWCNIDLRPFPGVDAALDVTQHWPFDDLDYVYSEHFLEHLGLLDGVRFLHHAAQSLRPGGKLRLSTPNLSWVMATHFAPSADPETTINDTMRTNRAFHGWGHQFLYTRDLLTVILSDVGFEESWSCAYGQSDDPELNDLERHGGFSVDHGQPSVVILEARRGPTKPEWPAELEASLRERFVRYVEAGH